MIGVVVSLTLVVGCPGGGRHHCHHLDCGDGRVIETGGGFLSSGHHYLGDRHCPGGRKYQHWSDCIVDTGSGGGCVECWWVVVVVVTQVVMVVVTLLTLVVGHPSCSDGQCW